MVSINSFAIGLALFATASAWAADAPAKGDTPPTYAGRQLDGTEINIRPGDGKAYVVSFWASWCGPCLQELPVLINIQKIAGADKIHVIAVNIEDRSIYRKLEPQIRNHGLFSAYDPNEKARDAYKVNAIPHMVIIGRDGRIQAVRKGYDKAALDELAVQLNEALAEPAMAAPVAASK